MKPYNSLNIKEETLMEPTQEMIDHFEKRTKKHIDLVQKYGDMIYKNPVFDFLPKQALKSLIEKHDASKYREPEYTPYLYISWDYKCKREEIKFKIPKKIQDAMNTATSHHVLTNQHHPEFWQTETVELINREDRDKPPEKLIDATKMPSVHVACMVADWAGMSEELNNCPYEWMEKNVTTDPEDKKRRWLFTERQVDLMNMLLEHIWDK